MNPEKWSIILDMAESNESKVTRPEVVEYHDYRVFLNDWLKYLETSDTSFSMRRLAQNAKVGVSTLSMIINSQRGLSANILTKLEPFLKLAPRELKRLRLLRELSEGNGSEAKKRALDKIQGLKDYQKKHPKEFETFTYLSQWHYVAIREMAGLQDFQLNAKWIQGRIREALPLTVIEEALDFLLKHKFITEENVGVNQKQLDCLGGVYRMALGAYHKQMFQRASESIDTVAPDDRLILGHTFSISNEQLPIAKEILLEALAKIESLSAQSAHSDIVYHSEFALIPLTRKFSGDRR